VTPVISREKAVAIRESVHPRGSSADRDVARLAETIVALYDQTAELAQYLEDIRYVTDHWNETARDNILKILHEWRFKGGETL
jgi:hypothetical protein